jgi:hypothetical protein
MRPGIASPFSHYRYFTCHKEAGSIAEYSGMVLSVENSPSGRSRDLGRLLGLGHNRAEEPNEGEGDADGEPQPHHLDSGPSNLFPRRF